LTQIVFTSITANRFIGCSTRY